MTVSLIDFWERASVGRDFWDKAKEEDLSKGAINLIKLGQEVRPDKSFWDDFISVFSSNNEDASELLGVSRDIVASWPSKIRKGIQKSDEDNIGKERSNMTNTGDRV